MRITRTSGDLEPAAYLYRGTEIFVRPDNFDVSASEVIDLGRQELAKRIRGRQREVSWLVLVGIIAVAMSIHLVNHD